MIFRISILETSKKTLKYPIEFVLFISKIYQEKRCFSENFHFFAIVNVNLKSA